MTSGNPTLDKNLDCIQKYNPQLKEALLNLPYLTNEINLIETSLKEPNLSYNQIPLHSQDGAESEAKKLFSEIQNTPSSRHIIFGIGLGHLFKECCENSKGIVFLYEPNLEILRVTLELVDFSQELSQNNVFVVSELEDFKGLYNLHYTYKANFSILTLSSYKNILYSDKIQDITYRIQVIAYSCPQSIRNCIQQGLIPLKTVLKNIPYTLKATPLYALKDIYKGKTALVVSAGPTLDLNIEIIKANRDKVIIFCVGTAAKALINNGITPDFINIIENSDCSGQLMDLDLSQTNLITEPYTHNSVYLLKAKQNLIFPSFRAQVNNYWADLTNIDISNYHIEGTVSYAALSSAKMLGFSKIILVGQDLAYLNNQCYSSNSAYADLAYEINKQTNSATFYLKNKENYIKSFKSANSNITEKEIEELTQEVLTNLIDSTLFVKGINGDMLLSNSGLASFIEYLSEFAYKNTDLDLINTSMVGAQINGFKNISLSDALNDNPVIESIELPKNFKYNIPRVLKNIEADLQDLIMIRKNFIDAKNHIIKFEKELKEKKMITAEAIGYFQALLSLYEKVSTENKSPLYKTIAFNEDIEVMYEIREAENIDLSKVEPLFKVIKTYFENINEKVIDITEKISITKEIIIESINSESEECKCIH